MSITASPGSAAAQPSSPTVGSEATLPLLNLERSIFSSSSFSAPILVNAVCQRALITVPKPSSASSSAGSPMSTLVIGSPSSLGGGLDVDAPQEEYQTAASRLVNAIEVAQSQVQVLLEEEVQNVLKTESQSRRVESSRKTLLNQIRTALKDTSQRIRSFEDAVANAITATVGIEQHLLQSNSRVTRGKAVSTLLRYFQMFTKIDPNMLSNILSGLSQARVKQRKQTTDYWENTDVSHLNPRYFTTLLRGGVTSQRGGGSTKKKKKRSAHDEEEESDNEDEEGVVAQDGDNNDDHLDDGIDEEGNFGNGETDASPNALLKVPMHTAELAAVSQGLDKVFASRYFTESQVEWALKLTVLSKELSTVVGSSTNVNQYQEWLKNELKEDCYHLVHCFREFYELNPDTATHVPYGKAVLKTLELVGRLYGMLCIGKKDDPTALLDLLIERSLESTERDLRATHDIKPLPPQPPLPELTMSSIMTFFQGTMRKDVDRVKEFLTQRLRREVILVEALVASGIGAGDGGAAGVSSSEATARQSIQHNRTRSKTSQVDGGPELGGDTSNNPGASSPSTTNISSVHSASGRQARQQLFAKIMDPLLKRYVSDASESATEYLRTTMSQEGALTPRSRRRCSGRVADAIAYSHSMTSELYGLTMHVLNFLETEFGAAEATFLYDFVPSIFPSQAAYVSERLEVELLKRYYAQADEQYMRALLKPVDEPFDHVPEHSKKASDITSRLEEVVNRVAILAPSSDVPLYVADLCAVTVSTMGEYLATEANKMLDVIKADRNAWGKKPKSEDTWISPTPKEAPLCAARIIIFIQSAIMRVYDSISRIASNGFLTSASAASILDFSDSAPYARVDELCEDLLNYIAASVVTKSLSILYYTQDKRDFLPKDSSAGANGKGAESESVIRAGGRPSTRACGLFCRYLSFQLSQLAPLLSTSCGQLWNAGGSNSDNSGGGGGGAVASSTASSATTQDQDRTLTSLRSKADAVKKVKRMTLQQLLFGDGGPTSLVRAIGVPLYRGIVAHLRGFRVNEGGALVYKQDVSQFALAMKPLLDTNGLDSLVVERLFELLKETAGLLFAALNNIRAVKNSGLLNTLMSNDEKVAFLMMREDLRDGFQS